MKNELSAKLAPVFQSYPEIKLAYLFGSQISKKTGPLSDYDFAIYASGKNLKKLFDLKFVLMDKIGKALATDKIDITILNLAESPELKYSIIKEGALIYEIEPFKVLVEPKILAEYFDFHNMLVRYNLTKAI